MRHLSFAGFLVFVPSLLLACSDEAGTAAETGGAGNASGGAAGNAGAASGASGTTSQGGSSSGSGGSAGAPSGGVTATGGLAGAGTGGLGGASGSGGAGGNVSGGSGGGAESGAGGLGGSAGSTAGGAGSGGAGGTNGGSSGTSGAGGGAGTGGKAGAGGKGGAGGMSGAAGKGGTGGSAGGGACQSPVASTSTRPQLTSTEAQNYTTLRYLARSGPFTSLTTDNWDPTAGLGSASSFSADFTVAADGSGTHTTLQAALNAVTGTARRYVLVKPGTYRGQVSYTGSTPVTLYAADTDATRVVIINNRSAQEGTSQTLNVRSNGFQIMNLTLSNDFPTPTSGTNIQALALLTNGDKIVIQNVRMHGFQDTVQFSAANATTISRVYVKSTFIEGDTDFIYGNATVVFDGIEVHYLSSRRGTGTGIMIAPSTSVDNQLGFLFVRCNFTGDGAAPANRIFLGRSWDASSTTPTPNGQAVIRESTLGAHVDRDTPWTSAATSGRPYSATGNRFSEYCNSGPGASP